jgi:hypothetical protein
MMQSLPHPKRRSQFSLLGLMTLMVLGALFFGLLSARRQNRKIVARSQQLEATMATLEYENARLRNELGELTIHDQQKIYAIRSPYLPKNTWTYRVYLPRGDTYFVAGCVNGLPTGNYKPLKIDETPPNTITLSGFSLGKTTGIAKGLKPGKYLVSLSVFEDSGTWRWKLSTKRLSESGSNSGSGGSALKKDSDGWPYSRELGMFACGGLNESQSETDLKQPLVLLDFRYARPNVDTTSNESPYGGLVWIDRVSNY